MHAWFGAGVGIILEAPKMRLVGYGQLAEKYLVSDLPIVVVVIDLPFKSTTLTCLGAIQELTPKEGIDRASMEDVVPKLLESQQIVNEELTSFNGRLVMQRSIKDLPAEPVNGVPFDQVPFSTSEISQL